MNGEHHESGEGDWRNNLGDGSRAQDELSHEEILRADFDDRPNRL